MASRRAEGERLNVVRDEVVRQGDDLDDQREARGDRRPGAQRGRTSPLRRGCVQGVRVLCGLGHPRELAAVAFVVNVPDLA